MVVKQLANFHDLIYAKQWALDVEAACIVKHWDERRVSAPAPAHAPVPAAAAAAEGDDRQQGHGRERRRRGRGAADARILRPVPGRALPLRRPRAPARDQPIIYKYGDGALEEEVAEEVAEEEEEPAPKRRR